MWREFERGAVCHPQEGSFHAVLLFVKKRKNSYDKYFNREPGSSGGM
jgi:hypothetical protein